MFLPEIIILANVVVNQKTRFCKRIILYTPCYKGFFINDKVCMLDKKGYITGFTTGGAYVKDGEGNYITLPDKSYKQVGISKLRLEHHNNNWQYIIKPAV